MLIDLFVMGLWIGNIIEVNWGGGLRGKTVGGWEEGREREMRGGWDGIFLVQEY